MIFLKKIHDNMIFSKYDLSSCIIWKDNIFLPENMILFFRRKIKDDASQKNTWIYDIFFKCPKKMIFPKKITLEYDLSCIIWKGVFFFWKTAFLWMEAER